MRIESGERKGFQEFSIVVESAEEAGALWHLTCVGSEESLVKYNIGKTLDVFNFQTIVKSNLHDMLNMIMKSQRIKVYK